MLSIILKKRSVYDWMTDTNYIPGPIHRSHTHSVWLLKALGRGYLFSCLVIRFQLLEVELFLLEHMYNPL